MTPLVRDALKLVPDPEELMWFDVGVFSKPSPPTGMLPFYKCGVVGLTNGGSRVLLVVTGDELVMAAFAYVVLADGDLHPTPTVKFVHVDGAWKPLEPEGDRAAITALVGLLGHFTNSIHPTGYRPTAKRSSILNQQRARKGKPPLQYDWHTVTIQPPQIKNEPQGGTHASPRLHDRRGHFRKLKSGSRVWVSPCKVGDAGKGTVFKDYKVAS